MLWPYLMERHGLDVLPLGVEAAVYGRIPSQEVHSVGMVGGHGHQILQENLRLLIIGPLQPPEGEAQYVNIRVGPPIGTHRPTPLHKVTRVL